MFQMILGAASSGKTTEIMRRISDDVKNGDAVVLIVPEQFSFESERAILNLLGDADAAKVDVLSFTRLCETVESEVGGIAGHPLSESDKLILLNRALKQASDELQLWNRYVGSVGFLSTLLQSIEELKQAAVSSDDLKQTAEKITSPTLRAKINDVATVFSFYSALLGERFSDASDRLDRLWKNLNESDYFRGKKVYLDSFKGFTGQQYRILDRIFAAADSVTVSMTVKDISSDKWDVFTNIRKTVNRLKRMATDRGIALQKDMILQKPFTQSSSLQAVENLLAGGKNKDIESDGSVTLFRAETPYDEANFVAQTIRRLIRENPQYRFRDFVVIARDTAPYEEAVSNTCFQNGIALFTDKRQPLNTLPPAVSVETAVAFAVHPSADLLFRFYKTGLGDFSEDDLFLLETYSFLWNLKISDWKNEWDMNPNGFLSDEPSEKDLALLEHLNDLRLRALNPLIQFSESFSGDAKKRVAALLQLLDTCNAAETFQKLADYYRDNQSEDRSDLLTQSWDSLMNVLNSIAFCYGDGELSAKDFQKTLLTATALTTVGATPQFTDEVIFGTADRIRPQRPKVAFILGANQGVFPKTVATGGLFAFRERAAMIEMGLEISDHGINDSIDEDFLVYTNLCCASEKLYILCSECGNDGKSMEPASFFSRILNAFPQKAIQEYLPETAEAVFQQACQAVSTDPMAAENLLEALFQNDAGGEYRRRWELIQNGSSMATTYLEPEIARRLYGHNIRLSASKLDVFQGCPFRYFCRYGLRAKTLQPAVFDALQRGTMVHYCLERLITEYRDNLSELSDDDIAECIRRFAEEYLDSIRGYRKIENPHTKYLVDNMVRSMTEVATQICHEFAQSEFHPVACELKFGFPDALPPLTVDFDGGTVSLSGSVDRVDTWNGYLRIVDYKTGKKEFKLPDILIGQNMQMLLYLYALLRNEEYADCLPAGIFYMPALRDKKDKGLAMNGLMPADEDLVRAMERENRGEYVPQYKLTQKGVLDVRKAGSFIEQEDFNTVFRYMDSVLAKTGQDILSGKASATPRNGVSSTACHYCEFSAVCGVISPEEPSVPQLKNDEVLSELKKEVEKHD